MHKIDNKNLFRMLADVDNFFLEFHFLHFHGNKEINPHDIQNIYQQIEY